MYLHSYWSFFLRWALIITERNVAPGTRLSQHHSNQRVRASALYCRRFFALSEGSQNFSGNGHNEQKKDELEVISAHPKHRQHVLLFANANACSTGSSERPMLTGFRRAKRDIKSASRRSEGAKHECSSGETWEIVQYDSRCGISAMTGLRTC